MGGLGRLFTKIIPIITLVCFLCLGITITFANLNQPNLTYLTTETINVGTEENPNNITYYNLNTIEYMSNMKVDILKQATENTIDTNTYQATINRFNEIWENGYNIGDVLDTIANAILLVINSLIIVINIIILPLRIISGLLLTAFTLIGININNGVIVIPLLKGILNNLAIPLISPTATKDKYINDLTNTQWYLTTLPPLNNMERYEVVINFKATFNNRQLYFWKYEFGKNAFGTYYVYYYVNGQQTDRRTIYWGEWKDQTARTITITDNNYTEEQVQTMTYELSKFFNLVNNRQIESTPVENETKSYIRYAI